MNYELNNSHNCLFGGSYGYYSNFIYNFATEIPIRLQ